jgi:putative endonuclease
MRDDHRKPLGRRGESVASEALRDHGYRILEQNYLCPLGEIDIVARKGRTLVFIEVKSDSGGRGILPKERVNKRKQRKLFQIAQFYIKEKRLQGISARFDVVQVRLDGEIRAVEVIANAFDVQE